jgi:predicted phage terminase large subunit-like protein
MIRVNASPVGLAWVDTMNTYVFAEHLKKLEDALIQVANGEIKRLAIFMPPRHGKSELTSKYFPAWYLGRNPECRIILASYESDFAAEWGAKVRNLLEEYGMLFETPITIDRGSSARNRWDIYGHKGGMQTAGVGAAVTGKGAKIMIIDDPVKDNVQANSETFRQRAKDWYRSTAYTRLEPDGAVILIQTRWHEDDLGGWILENSDEDWTILDLPAINEQGEPLWPDRYSIKRLLEIKKEVGEYWWSAMYQQQPQPPEGGILKRSWIQYYDPKEKKSLLSNSQTFTGWDLAISEKETADYTCSCTVKVSNIDGNIYITDWTREHMDFPSQINEVRKQNERWNPAVIALETNAYQLALLQALREYRLPLKGINRIKDKVSRITSAFTAFEQGRVFIPQDHPLMYEFENEYVHFPTGTHDDLLDATELALALARTGGNPYTDSDKYYDFSSHNRQEKGRRKHAYL